MVRSPLARFVSLLLVLVVAACGGGSGQGVPETTLQTRIRVFNLIADAGPITLTADSNLIASGLSFEAVSDYQNIASTAHEFRVTTAGGGAVSDVTSALIKGTDYTYVVAGSLAAAVPVALGTNPNLPTPGNFTLRLTNAAAVTGALDIYVATPDNDINNSVVTASLANASSTAFATFSTGSYHVIAALAGTKQVVFDSAPITFIDGASPDIVFYNRASGTLINMALINADRSGSAMMVANPLAQIKVVNAVTGSPPLNVFLNGSPVFANVPLASASSYQAVGAGMPQLTVQAATTPGANLLATSVSLAGGTDNTVVLTGTTGALLATVLNDNNLPPSSGNARLRVANASADGSTVDVYVTFVRTFAALPVNTASPYVEFADGAYQIDFNVAGTASALLDLPSVRLTAGSTYSIYLVGPNGAAHGIVTRN